ncbi:SGNH hydrolase-type esterase domain-containing protein [Coemansia spiralis]|nr:SGNH hydrolase-type esterase domain-containing protein [Coemansia spiralis]
MIMRATTWYTQANPVVRYLIPAALLGLAGLNFVYFSNSFTDNTGATHPPASTMSYSQEPAGGIQFDYPMYDVLLAFGDSITQFGNDPTNSGWLTHLSRYYERRMDVLNRGFSGYTTKQARQIAHRTLPKVQRKAVQPEAAPSNARRWLTWLPWLPNSDKMAKRARDSKWPGRDGTFPASSPVVQLCTIFFGANDAALEGSYQHIPLDQYTENLRYLAGLLRSPDSEFYSPDTRILIITPPALGDRMHEDWSRRTGWSQPARKNAVTKKYAEAAIAVAKELDLPYVDLWTAIQTRVQKSRERGIQFALGSDREQDISRNFTANAPLLKPGYSNGVGTVSKYDGYEKYLIDGLHLNSNGNKLLFRLVVDAVTTTWPEMKPSYV